MGGDGPFADGANAATAAKFLVAASFGVIVNLDWLRPSSGPRVLLTTGHKRAANPPAGLGDT